MFESRKEMSWFGWVLTIIAFFMLPIGGYMLGNLIGLACGVILGLIVAYMLDWHNVSKHSRNFFLQKFIAFALVYIPVTGYFLAGEVGIVEGAVLVLIAFALLGVMLKPEKTNIGEPKPSRVLGESQMSKTNTAISSSSKESPVKQNIRQQREHMDKSLSILSHCNSRDEILEGFKEISMLSGQTNSIFGDTLEKVSSQSNALSDESLFQIKDKVIGQCKAFLSSTANFEQRL